MKELCFLESLSPFIREECAKCQQSSFHTMLATAESCSRPSVLDSLGKGHMGLSARSQPPGPLQPCIHPLILNSHEVSGRAVTCPGCVRGPRESKTLSQSAQSRRIP